MANFTHLKKYKVTADDVVDYEMPELGKKAVLQLRSATEGNPGYMNGLLRLTGNTNGARRQKNKSIDAETLGEARVHDRELYPVNVIVGWKNVPDDKGKNVKFSVKEAAELIEQLPDYLFDDMRAFANAPENFVAVIDSEEKGKN